MALGVLCKQTRPFDEYIAEETAARAKNVIAFDHELQMAGLLFEAAQEVYAHVPASDRLYWRVQASLLTATMRYYATAIDLCLRGNAAEALGVMRSSLENAAYVVRIASSQSLAERWVEMDTLTKRERDRLFGSDSRLMEQPQIAKAARPIYSLFSIFGTHARITAAEQTIDFQHPYGWRMRHAEEATQHIRYFLLAILFAMRDVITLALVPSLLDGQVPRQVTKPLDEFESIKSSLGSIRRQFLRWIKNPTRPRTQTRVIGMSAVLVDNSS